MALPSAPQEREQGAVQETEALAATAPPPIEPTPTQADVASEGAVAQAAQQAVMGTGPEPDMPVAPQQGYTVKNPMLLLPPSTWMPKVTGQQSKTPVEGNFDVGMLFSVLGSRDPIMKIIADELMGK
jgi:hypothetical protein